MSKVELNEVYEALADKFITYKDMSGRPVKDDGSKLVPIGEEFTGKIHILEDYRLYTGDHLFVREALIPMLVKAQAEVKAIHPDYDLEIYCGYRSLDIQKSNFERITKLELEADPTLEGDELKERAHRFSAAPDVAGHPTGGAVDVQIVTPEGPIDFGTPIHSYAKDTYTLSPFISKKAWHNRQLLRACMLKVGFAPLDSEWWHFSYGDREWAAYFNKPHALFTQLPVPNIEE